MFKKISKKAKKLLNAFSQKTYFQKGKPPTKFNDLQLRFCEWNAERLGISVEESKKRLEESWASILGGFSDTYYRQFCDLSYNIFRVFWDDNETEIWEAYRFHGPMHMLRMLSYEEPKLDSESPIISHLPHSKQLTILDFGCGLAQTSQAIITYLKASGISTSLVLADIPTIRKDFLIWLGTKSGINMSFLDCTQEMPIPKIPSVDVCIATEVFEHLHDPMPYLLKFHEALSPGGLLLTNINDHRNEYMHVTPNLSLLRQKLQNLSYHELEPNTLYKKPE